MYLAGQRLHLCTSMLVCDIYLCLCLGVGLLTQGIVLVHDLHLIVRIGGRNSHHIIHFRIGVIHAHIHAVDIHLSHRIGEWYSQEHMVYHCVHTQHIALRHVCQYIICQVAHAYLCLQLHGNNLLSFIEEMRGVEVKVVQSVVCTYHGGAIYLQCYIPILILSRNGISIVIYRHLGIQYIHSHFVLGIKHLVRGMYDIDIAVSACDSSIQFYLLQEGCHLLGVNLHDDILEVNTPILAILGGKDIGVIIQKLIQTECTTIVILRGFPVEIDLPVILIDESDIPVT